MESQQQKQQVKNKSTIAIFGPENSGKSTLIGRILTETNQQYKNNIDKLKTQLLQMNMIYSLYSFQVDKLNVEKERGITIISKIKLIKLNNYEMTIIDTPGHKNYIKNMLSGISQSDYGLMVVDCRGYLMDHIKEQLGMVFAYGIRQIIIAVNKIDESLNPQQDFDNIKSQLTQFMTKTGYKFTNNNISFLPIIAYQNQNLITKPDHQNLSFYKGHSLFELMDKLQYNNYKEKYENKPLRISVRNVDKIGGVGTVVCGRILQGTLKKNDEVQISTQKNKKFKVNSIQMHYQDITIAYPGYQIGFNLKNISTKEIKAGDMIGQELEQIEEQCFQAKLLVLKGVQKIKVGFSPVIFIHSLQVQCKLIKIQSKTTKDNKLEINPKQINAGETAIVLIKPIKNIYVETYDKLNILGRFIIRELNQTIAVGIIQQTNFIDDLQDERSNKEILDKLGNISDSYVCPITKCLFTDPVVTADGMTYEKNMIEKWFKYNNTSPLTGLKLSTKALHPNIALRNLVQELIQLAQQKP